MNRPDFIKNYKDCMKEDNNHYSGSDELLTIGSPVGKLTGLTKIGVHIETLLPGRRTSWPHAESHEEEFAYVIEGAPQAWVDGEVYDLKPGDFVGFPSGTGISHTFINNTEEIVLILVGGEASKGENQYIYPLHPEMNSEIKKDGFLWEDCPKRKIGDHDGLPDKQRKKK